MGSTKFLRQLKDLIPWEKLAKGLVRCYQGRGEYGPIPSTLSVFRDRILAKRGPKAFDQLHQKVVRIIKEKGKFTRTGCDPGNLDWQGYELRGGRPSGPTLPEIWAVACMSTKQVCYNSDKQSGGRRKNTGDLPSAKPVAF